MVEAYRERTTTYEPGCDRQVKLDSCFAETLEEASDCLRCRVVSASKPSPWITRHGSVFYQTACQSANLSFCVLLTSPSFNRLIKMTCFLKPGDYGIQKLPENIISINLFKLLPVSELCCARVTRF
ncbi:hypothetical protein ATANTOWER_006726 [Ataeniobius toweri]|uniref:Uncharacterized protein n=1 Tax=Ataeniobius toweri TaxID=208326 RepID=A0ABU7AIR0_9TELE|nr:hypothetical protein [Ataeniobius toweri]